MLILLLSYLNGLYRYKTEAFGYKSDKLSVSLDSCFAKTWLYLKNRNYFTEVVDRSSGFIRAKGFIESTKVLSQEVGEKRTLSFLPNPPGKESIVSLDNYNDSFIPGDNINTLSTTAKAKPLSIGYY